MAGFPIDGHIYELTRTVIKKYYFNIFGDIRSQPVDLVVSKLANKSNTDSSVDSTTECSLVRGN